MVGQAFDTLSKMPGKNWKAKLFNLVSFVLVASMASYAFEGNYFNYKLLDPSDLNGYYQFFLKGHFFIPLVLFAMLWLGTRLIGATLFMALNRMISNKINRLLRQSFPEYMLRYETSNRVNISEEACTVRKSIAANHNKFEKQFVFLFRFLLAATTYFFTLDYFGALLFSVLTVGSVLFLIGLVLLFQFLEFTPRLLYWLSNLSRQENELV